MFVLVSGFNRFGDISSYWFFFFFFFSGGPRAIWAVTTVIYTKPFSSYTVGHEALFHLKNEL